MAVDPRSLDPERTAPGLAQPQPLPAEPVAGRPRVARGTTGPAAVAAPAELAGDGMYREPALNRWARRAVTIPAVFLIAALYTALLPLLLFYAVLSDAVHRRPLLLSRFHLVFWSVLVWHCIGVLALFGLWLIRPLMRWDATTFRHWNSRTEGWWCHKNLGIASVFYGAEFLVEDAHVVAPGPVLVLSRHASTLDTIVPGRALSRGKHGLTLRIVKKREILLAPAADVISTRVPCAFVRRGTSAVRREIEQLIRLCDGMDHDDAVVIFPEGTRFSVEKQAELIAKLRTKDAEAGARAARLRNVLPPRPLGTFALLDARPDMDVVFCAHTGLEGANRLDDMVNGTLLGTKVRVKFWRVPRAEVPDHPDARLAWLQGWWERVDQWIEEHRAN